MKTTTFVAFILAAGFAAVGTSANAESRTATFQVLLKVLKSCSVTAGDTSNVQIGSAAGELSTASDLTGSNSFNVTCTSGTDYAIGLSPSTLNGGTADGTGYMIKTGTTIKVRYALYQNAAMNSPWGNTTGTSATAATTNTKGGTGTGSAQQQTVWAKVAGSLPTSTQAGDYADTVTVTLTY